MTDPAAALPAAEVLAALGTRYACLRVGSGGVAVDLQSGHYWALNGTAAQICTRLLSSAPAALVGDVSTDFGLLPAQAAQAIASVLAHLGSGGAAPPVPTDDFPYWKRGEEYVLHHRTTPLLRVDATGTTAHLEAAPGVGAPLEHVLRLASPKILQANGLGVLHAAASGGQGDAPLVVFSGRSGAGKSTTARLLDQARGTRPFADDMLVLAAPEGDGPGEGALCAYAGAEAAIYRWCAQAAHQLSARPSAPLPLAGLLATARADSAPRVPIDRLIFVAADRRQGDQLRLTPLLPEQAVLELLNSVFLGATTPSALQHFLVVCGRLATSIPAARAQVPDGLAALQAALGRDLLPQISKTTSNF